VETTPPAFLGAFTRDFCAEDLLECLSINPGRIGDEMVGRARAIEFGNPSSTPAGPSPPR